ncbi:hypothetical protein TNCV_3647701 [Trichonephila clavipes]|nr:hypothetical protein TNCV_3647701 [Trichonephila clavipes]
MALGACSESRVISTSRDKDSVADQYRNQFCSATGSQLSQKTFARHFQKDKPYVQKSIACVPSKNVSIPFTYNGEKGRRRKKRRKRVRREREEPAFDGERVSPRLEWKDDERRWR